MRMVAVVAAGSLLLLSGGLFAASARGRGVKHSAAECRAACQARNLPASCAWLTPAPQHCLREALRACEKSQLPGPAPCVPPKDLPACGSNHGCPYGALCLDSTCQVLGCGSQNGFADCTAYNRCEGNQCVVAECSAVTANCPRGFHCEPANPPFSDISGTCLPDVPGVAYCTWSGDCIAQGNFNPTCIQGICAWAGARPTVIASDGAAGDGAQCARDGAAQQEFAFARIAPTTISAVSSCLACRDGSRSASRAARAFAGGSRNRRLRRPPRPPRLPRCL
jgi:hypothetical protein